MLTILLFTQLLARIGKQHKGKLCLIVKAGKGQQQVSSQNRREHKEAGRVSEREGIGQNRAGSKQTIGW